MYVCMYVYTYIHIHEQGDVAWRGVAWRGVAWAIDPSLSSVYTYNTHTYTLSTGRTTLYELTLCTYEYTRTTLRRDYARAPPSSSVVPTSTVNATDGAGIVPRTHRA